LTAMATSTLVNSQSRGRALRRRSAGAVFTELGFGCAAAMPPKTLQSRDRSGVRLAAFGRLFASSDVARLFRLHPDVASVRLVSDEPGSSGVP
jgi:hypothetical protein